MVLEIIEGRGCGPEGDHVFLKLDHLGEEVLDQLALGIFGAIPTLLLTGIMLFGWKTLQQM